MTDSSDVSTLIAQIELARTRRLDPAHPDTEAIRSTSLKALDPTLLRDYLTSCRSRSRRLAALDDAEILRAAGVTAPSGESRFKMCTHSANGCSPRTAGISSL